jgi:amino acid adenylation domain-containing protein
MLDKADGISLRSGFLRNASLRGEAPALVVRGATLSYSQVEETARRWASAILAVSSRQPERIGIFGYRSEVSYTGTLAAMLAGATFVPLNPTYPVEKTASMIQRADLDAIIIDKTAVPQVELVMGKARLPLLCPELDNPRFGGVSDTILDFARLNREKPLLTLPAIVPEDNAYLLFTSGSTGAPKGVPVTHGNATYFMDVMSRRYAITPEDRFSQTFDQTFDLSVFDLFMAWTNGASIHSLSTINLLAPTKFVNEHQITVWFSVPSVPAHMRNRGTLKPNSMRSLRWSLFCGEPLPKQSAEAWQAAAPNSIVENLYGPTELTIACFVHRWDAQQSPELCRNDLVPIGRPYDGLAAMVVDENFREVPEGIAGELCVSGPQTTYGYWNDPVKTAERYLSLPISSVEKRRFYWTGDRVIRLKNGEYAFLGRTDNQIKVLGHRVELGEIEAILRKDERVEHAVAFGWPIADGSAQGVVAFVSGREIIKEDLKALSKANLPSYMAPTGIFVVSEMPLNANGKVDRGALKLRLESGSPTEGRHKNPSLTSANSELTR